MGEKGSQTITEARLARLTAVDHGRVLTEGSGLSGKVVAGRKGAISVYFRYRYRFDGNPRDMSLGAWPRCELAAIRHLFEEVRLRIERGGDPAGQKRVVARKMRLEQEQIEQQQQEQAEQARQQAEQQLTVKSLFDAWFPVAQADITVIRSGRRSPRTVAARIAAAYGGRTSCTG